MKAKVTVSVDEALIEEVDERVEQGAYESRSAAVEAALELLSRQRRDGAFVRELLLLDPEEERQDAELGMKGYREIVVEEHP